MYLDPPMSNTTAMYTFAEENDTWITCFIGTKYEPIKKRQLIQSIFFNFIFSLMQLSGNRPINYVEFAM